jgi:hypothetical protein
MSNLHFCTVRTMDNSGRFFGVSVYFRRSTSHWDDLFYFYVRWIIRKSTSNQRYPETTMISWNISGVSEHADAALALP